MHSDLPILQFQISLATVSAILKAEKRHHKKIDYDPYKITGSKPPSCSQEIRPGIFLRKLSFCFINQSIFGKFMTVCFHIVTVNIFGDAS